MIIAESAFQYSSYMQYIYLDSKVNTFFLLETDVKTICHIHMDIIYGMC